MKFGVDISKWNGDSNFLNAKNLEFVILRASCGKNKDIKFERFYKECKDAKINIGTYHYVMAKNKSDAVVEAKIFESCLKNKQFEYPIYCDMEYGNLSKRENTDICKAFCNYLESRGFYVGIYANLNWFKNKLYSEELKSYDKWIAHYVKNIDFSKYKNSDYDMWQFTNAGSKYFSTIGVTGEGLDVNICYKKDYPEIIKKAGLNGFKKEMEGEKILILTYNNDTDKIIAEWINENTGIPAVDLRIFKTELLSKYKLIHIGGNAPTNVYKTITGSNRYETMNKANEFCINYNSN